MHKCKAESCAKQIPEQLLMCGPHWGMVNPILQQEIVRLWEQNKSEDLAIGRRVQIIREYRQAVDEAVKEVAQAEAPRLTL